MSDDAKKSRARLVLGVGIAMAAVGLTAVAYIPRSDPLMLAGSTATVMLGYLIGRWALLRLVDDDR